LTTNSVKLNQQVVLPVNCSKI